MANKYKYTYGRKVTENKYMNDVISLPTKDNKPDWEFMERYICYLKHKKLSTNNKRFRAIDISKWVEFRFGDLISNIYKGRALNKDDLLEVDKGGRYIRYITRTTIDNGCELFASLDNINDEFIESGNAITIGDTTATCFYQDEPFITGDHMVVVRADWLNKYTGIYIVAILTNEQYKYSYGRAYLMDRIKDTILKLPAKKIDDILVPDWEYMEKYIKSLPYGDRL